MTSKEEEFTDVIGDAIKSLHLIGGAGHEDIIVDLVNDISRLSGNPYPILELEVKNLDEYIDEPYDMESEEEIEADVTESFAGIMEVVDTLLDDRAHLMEKNRKLIEKIRYLEGEKY